MAPLESPRSAKCSLSGLFSLPSHLFQNCFLSSRRYVYFKKTRPPAFSWLPSFARIASDARKVEQLMSQISFMISVRPPGKPTVRTAGIQMFGVCFSLILGDGLATSGESLDRDMACATSRFPRAIPGRPLSPTARAPTRTTEPEILPRCPGSGPVGRAQNVPDQ